MGCPGNMDEHMRPISRWLNFDPHPFNPLHPVPQLVSFLVFSGIYSHLTHEKSATFRGSESGQPLSSGGPRGAGRGGAWPGLSGGRRAADLPGPPAILGEGRAGWRLGGTGGLGGGGRWVYGFLGGRWGGIGHVSL